MSNRMVFSSIRMPSSISYKSGKLLSLLRKTFSSVINVSSPHLTSIHLCSIMMMSTNKPSGVLIVCTKSPTKENSDNTFWITADRLKLVFCSLMCRKSVDADTPTWSSSRLWNNEVRGLLRGSKLKQTDCLYIRQHVSQCPELAIACYFCHRECDCWPDMS